MSMEHRLNVHKSELELPGSLYVSPETLAILSTMPRGEPLTWGATPLDPHRKDVAAQQREVNRQLHDLFPKSPDEVPYGLNWATAQYIQDNYDMRTHHRVSRNYDSYQNRGKYTLSDVPLELLDVANRSLSGHAAPLEIGITGEVLEIATRELGSVSLIYGHPDRMKHIQPMREAVEDSIIRRGGTLSKPNHTYEVVHASHLDPRYNDAEPSLLMTRTIDIGAIGDEITDVERSSFNVILPRLQGVNVATVQSVKYDEFWSERILGLPHFQEAIDEALNQDEYSVAVPVSVTSLEMNSRLIETLLKNKKHIEARQREIAMRALAESGTFILFDQKN